MPTYDEIRSTTDSYESGSGGGRWDTERFARERDERMYRGPAPPLVREPSRSRSRSRPRPPPPPPSVPSERFDDYDHRRRPRREYDDRFERRVVEEDSYGPPGRRRDRFVEEDDFYETRGSGPLVHRRREPEPFHPPRLVRRQSSLDTFDRQPARRIERAPPIRGVPHRGPPPLAPRPHRRPSVDRRYVERDEYEEIDIAEPDIYGDEDYHHFRERERPHLVREEIVKEKIIEKEKPYPRKGKTKMPKRLVHPSAVQALGYPYIEEEKVIIIQRALSKELIDEIVTMSRDIRRRSDNVVYERIESSSPPVRERDFVERIVVASPSPVRAERFIVEQSPSPVRAERFVVEASPSPTRYRSPSRVRVGRFLERPEMVETRRPRSVSVNYARASSPVIIDRRGAEELRGGAVTLVERPRRDINEEIRLLEDERRMLQVERRPENVDSVDIIKDKIVHRSDGVTDEIIEKKDRKVGDSRIIRAMMATLT